MAQWKAYVPGCVKWVKVADVPVAVDPEGVPLSHTSGWLAKGPVKVTLSPVLIIGFADMYEYMPGPPFGKVTVASLADAGPASASPAPSTTRPMSPLMTVQTLRGRRSFPDGRGVVSRRSLRPRGRAGTRDDSRRRRAGVRGGSRAVHPGPHDRGPQLRPWRALRPAGRPRPGPAAGRHAAGTRRRDERQVCPTRARVTVPRAAGPAAGTRGGRVMGPRGRRAAIVVTMVALSMLVAGGVVAATRSSDESALAPARHAADRGIERKVDRLLSQMTVGEKLQQLQLLSDGQITDADAKNGVGAVFSLVDPAKINHFQHIAVEQSRLHIPTLFASDTIHGYRTIFPVPLGPASSFDPSVPTADDTVAARETATVGIKQIYSPMVDVSHEPRWGRISEAAGEDPYLGSVFAAARVKAAQGNDYSAPDKVVTSVKHFAAYGQPEGGREYNTTDMSEQRLRNLYLPPFKAAIDAGSDTVMCSFNAISGVPGCADPETETDILKHEWGFDGCVESDYPAVAELRACPPVNPNTGPCGHGVA